MRLSSRITRRAGVLAAVAVLALAGGAVAVTRGGGDDERKAFLNDAAKRLDVSPEKLSSALQGAASDRLDAAVAAGRMTKEQADAIKEHMKREGGVPFLGGPPPGGRHHGPHAGIDAAAKFLGLTEAQLRQQVQSGKSLADVAKARDKSVDGLKDAIEAAIRKDLDRALADKRITKAQHDDMLSHLDEHVDRMVERTGPPGPPGGGRGFRGGPDGHGRPGGPGFGPPPGDMPPG
ncbi:MAG TPA: hypothetical protein VF520_00560 [Thermoleophilaceae bacterium]|jgi:hypothetical protein